MRFLRLLLLALFAYAANAAAQNDAAADLAGFLPGVRYVYSYRSSSDVYQDVSLIATGQVTLQSLNSPSGVELLLTVEDKSLTWETTSGSHTDQTDPLGDLSRWFSATVGEDGTITNVFLPSNEKQGVSAFKKSLVQLLVLSGAGDIERVVTSTVGLRVTERTHRDKITEKVLIFDEARVLQSVVSDERLTSNREDLLGYPIHSHSELTLIENVNTAGQDAVQRPTGLVSETILINNVTDFVPLSEMESALSSLLASCTSVDDTHPCVRQLVASLKLLRSQELTIFVKRQLTGRGRDFDLSEAMLLVDALSYLGSGNFSDVLSHLIDSFREEGGNKLVSKILFHLTSGRLQSDRSVVDAVSRKAFGGEDVSASLRQSALLALGGMARHLRSNHENLSNSIVEELHSALSQFSSSDAPRLRRSTDGHHDHSLHAVLIDSIGNARALQSQTLLMDHVTGSHGNLAAKHAAVKALQGFDTEESAQALLDVAENNPHLTVQHRAARAYQSHSRRRRDLSHIIHSTNHHRSRRNTDGSVSNVSMPAVAWRQEFGEPNITVGVSRVLLNSFDIDTGYFSSNYTFSLHDETSFDTSLLLSSGEQHSEMLRTELCLQGTATYDVNILNDFTYNLTAHQFNRFSLVVPSLQRAFQDAYQQIVTSENEYSGLQSAVQETVDNLLSRFNLVDEMLEQFRSTLDGLRSTQEFVLKQEAERILLDVNATFTNARDLAQNSLQALSSSLSDLLPSRPQTLTSSLIVDRLPFIDSPFYVQYLPFAPQKALVNIFSVYRRAQILFNELETSYKAFELLSSPRGTNFPWLSSSIFLRTSESDISSLLEQLVEAIDTADKSPSQNYDGASLSEFQSLRSAVISLLQPGVEGLKNVGNDLFSASQRVMDAFQQSQSAIRAFTLAYEDARSSVDIILGQRFHPDFPHELRSCDISGSIGCGTYPATTGDQYQEGIDVVVDQGVQILSPLSANIQLFDINAIPVSAQSLHLNYSASSSIIVHPEESSFNSIYFILSNIVPATSITVEQQYYQSGEVIGSASSTQLFEGKSFIHIEAYKVLNGQVFSVDPTQFLQPDLNVNVNVEFDCNDLVTYVGGAVVERRSVATSDEVSRTLVGDPLVQGIPEDEFPQPYDLVIESSDTITSGDTPVQFFQSSTFIMVGQIPVQFEFSSVGDYQVNYSLSASFLSKTLQLPVTPYFHARAEGFMRVGSTVFALVENRGTLLEILLPLTLKQDYSVWPLQASSAMDIVLVPSDFNLTTQLVQRTGAGQFAEQEVLQSNTIWQYSIPSLNNDEFFYQGMLSDSTPPLFMPLTYPSATDCFVRQLPGRDNNNPAFEIEFEVTDQQSVLNITYSVGTYLNGENVLERTELGGKRLVVPQFLLPEEELYFTVAARNLQNEESFASCMIPDEVYYDRSPPLARINPIRPISSHRSQIAALVVLFDEHGFNVPQEIAIGLVPGESGTDVLPWTQFDVSTISSPPTIVNDVMDLFSFGRRGRFFGDIIQTYTSMENVRDCATVCSNQDSCLSFDYSQEQSICITHSNIEGPEEVTFENIFETPSLQTSRSYYHYEKLGVGNSTVVSYGGLSFEHNRLYYINMRLRSSLGLTNIVSSSGFLADFTPPSPGKIRNRVNDITIADSCDASSIIPGCIEYNIAHLNHRIIVDGTGSGTVFNGPVPLLDAMYASATNYITANWNGFLDSESGIYAYTWCVGTSIGYCDVLNQTDPHAHFGMSNQQAWTNTALASSLDLTDGAYYISVQAINNVEYGGPLVTTVHHSTPYIIDTSPPTLTEVNNIEYDTLTNELRLNYSAYDNGSGIASVSLALGRTQYDTSLLPWISIESNGTASVTVYIPDGMETWIKLRAMNNAGLLAIAVSEEAITVDRTPPLAGTVNDGEEVGTDIDYTESTTRLCVNWQGFSDPESGISLIQWAIGRTPGDSNVLLMDLTSVDVARSRACASINLIHNTTYYSTLTVFNSAMNMQSTSVSSDGVRVDNTPPVAGIVYDGLIINVDQSYSSSLTTVEANWNGFYDYESSVARYTITVYRQSGGSLTMDAVYSTMVDGTVTHVSLTQFSFTNGDQIFVEVVASNGAGLTGTATSNGYTIDLTPPQVSNIVDGTDLNRDIDYQSSNATYSVSWDVTDDESGIAQIEGAVFQIREGRRMKVYPTSPLEPYITIPISQSAWSIGDELSLEVGARYIASIAFTNGAGLRVVYETNGVIVDPTPPTIQTVSVSTDTYVGDEDSENMVVVLADPDFIEAQWAAFDPESGISGYHVGIVDDNGTLVLDYIRFEKTDGGVLRDARSTLDSESVYRVAVIAINLAGQESRPAYSNKFRISVGDSAGIVMDGPLMDIDYTDEVTAVTAQFIGFESELCGGISSYEWAVGEGYQGRGRESVMSFTTRGVVVEANGTGYAQVNLPNLRSYGSQTLFVTIRGITGCGDVLESTSNGFVIDPSPPSLEIIDTGPQAIERTQFSGDLNVSSSSTYQTEAGYSSIWRASDDESGLSSETTVDIGTYPNGRDIVVNGMTVSDKYIREDIMSVDGVATYVTVTVTNGAGVVSTRTSRPIVRDTTPPITGEMSCKAKGYPKPIHLWQTDFQQENAGFIICSWNGFIDPQSSITSYAVSIGTSPTDQSILMRTDINAHDHINSYTSPLIVFTQNIPYFVTLYTTNGARLERIFTSEPVYFDTTPPVFAGTVSVLRNFGTGEYNMGDITIRSIGMDTAACLYDTDIVSILFQAPLDPESNTTFRYKLGIGYTPGNDDLLMFRPISPTPFTTGSDILHYQINPINFTDANRQGIYFSIQVYNCHGLYSVLSSNIVYIKSNLTLQPSWLYDGNNSNSDIEYQDSTTQVNAYVHVGINCPIETAQWAVESVDGMLTQDYIEIEVGADSLGLKSNTFFLFSDQVLLYHDESYRVLFRAIDRSGESFVLQSNGFTVTTSAVKPGLVQDGSIPGQDLNYQEPTNMLWAQWSGFGDGSPEQEIVFYEVAAGSDREYPSTRTDIAPFTNVSLNTSHVFYDLDLTPESITYFITVRAHTVSGAYIEVTSNGISVGYQQGILPGEITLNRYQSDVTRVSVYWSEFESDLPIRMYEWALGTRRFTESELASFCDDTDSNFTQYFEVFGFGGVHLDTTATATGLNLQHNITYYVTVRAIDQAKKCKAVLSSNGLTIDSTEPIPDNSPRSIILGPSESRDTVPEDDPYVIYVLPEQQMGVSWNEFQDAESKIASYEVGIFEQLGGCGNNSDLLIPIRDFVDAGEEREVSFGILNLREGVSYVAVVRATNGAGLTRNEYSQPIVVDAISPLEGTVKDGDSWENDVIFQSDVSMLSAAFTHAKLPVSNFSGTLIENRPCPTVAFFNFQTLSPPWEALSSAMVIGHTFGSIEYRRDQVGLSSDSPGVQITAKTDSFSTNPQILTGAYETVVQLSTGGVVSVDILAAFGTRELEENTVTAVTFIDSEEPATIPLFEPEISTASFPDINAFGVQIYRNQSSQSVVLWMKSTNPLSRPIYVRQDLSHLNLSIAHTYSINFMVKQPSTREADLLIDGVLEATLQNLPPLTDNTSIVLHMFNKLGQVPPIDLVSGTTPAVQAIFSNVHLPLRMGHLCDYGTPFFSLGSPIVEFRAGIGTLPGIIDVRDYETIAYPCLPCGNGPCTDYGCESNCTDVDPYTITLTFRDLNLDDGYYSDIEQSLSSGGGLPLHLTNENAQNVLSDPLTDHFQPPVYYVTVEAITASGKRFSASSNGVTIDTSPPVLEGPIEQFDVTFSTEEPTIFQGNNDTISARWQFQDPQSGIVEYLWAIGSYPYGDDVQEFASVGTATEGTNSSLLGTLEANTTYYVTVVAVNGAGLRSNATSEGITYLETEINVTALELIVEIEFAEVLMFVVNDTVSETLRTVREDRASIFWTGVSDDIEEIFWYIGSDPELYQQDVFPRTRVNFNDSQSATIDSGVLYLDANAFANVSEIIALADGKEEDLADNLFFFEPGRLLYNSLEFCNFVHRCAIIRTTPSILIRTKDGELTATGQEEVVLTHVQEFPPGVNRRRLPTLDRQYTVTLRTNGLHSTSQLFVGFLNQSDITREYRVRTPYISNPHITMAQTSRMIARRFTEIGGPSFYVSFLGQDSLNAPLEINVTYDSSLDWTVAFPELGYWDIDEQVWREVSATCMNSSRVDESTFTIAVQVCSTVLTETVTRPVSLSRRRRQTMETDMVTSSGMGSGTMDMGFIPVTNYLDRPVQFILMRVGNVSTNTAPQLLLPSDPVEIIEDMVLESYQIEFMDGEGDFVDFYLASLPKLGNVTLTLDGLLTYAPCENCTGVDSIDIYVIERPFGENHIPLPASGRLLINIINVNDNPEVVFYTDIDSDIVTLNSTLFVYTDANRTAPAIVASIAAFDYDGYHSDLTVFVTNGANGASSSQIWLDAVNTPESLPLTFPGEIEHNLEDFMGYISFTGAYITYLPNSPNFVGTDTLVIRILDSNGRPSRPITLVVEVLPSLCQNNGVCGGSDFDPNCTDIAARRESFDGYNCSCLSGFEGEYCEIEVRAPDPGPMRDCPPGVPMFQCDGDPCSNAVCPSHPVAECRADFCGSCRAKWFVGEEQVTCNADSSEICARQQENVIIDCSSAQCDCPTPPYQCPPDSIIISTRVDFCCVSYECVCPNISCPLLMECGQGVQPIPDYRGNGFPGRCCPDYSFEDINECLENSENLCSDGCVDEPTTYSCNCPAGTTLAKDGFNCGVCPYNGFEYLLGDRVKIGCNWCICRGDELSGERWHCTANTCDRGCIRDGAFYPVGSNISDENLICTCEPTDVNAQWMCSVDV